MSNNPLTDEILGGRIGPMSYDLIASIVFRPDYPGYRPEVKEIPNADGKVDEGKRYAHVSPKSLKEAQSRFNEAVNESRLLSYHAHDIRILNQFYGDAFGRALDIAKAVGLPEKYHPSYDESALRLLDYPPGAGSNEHADFSLFTTMEYRDQPDKFVYCGRPTYQENTSISLVRTIMRRMNAQVHVGEIGAAVGLGPADRHRVDPSSSRQRSVVFFAIPDHDSVLPDGRTVRGFLNDRMSQSRTQFNEYK